MRKRKYNFVTYEFLELEHYKNKKSLGEIAKENNIPKGSIKFICKKLNFKPRNNKEANELHFTDFRLTKEKLVKWYITKNKSIKDIAEKFKVSTATVYSKLKKFGITIKPHGAYKVWNKGLSRNNPRVIAKAKKQSKTLKQKYASGELVAWNKDKPMDEEQKQKLKNNHWSKTGSYVPPTGFKHSEEAKSKMSLAKGGTGIPYENNKKISAGFTPELRDKVRKTFNNECALCGKTQQEHLDEFGAKLAIHHRDLNNRNNDIDNLVALCGGCHTKVHHAINRNEEILI